MPRFLRTYLPIWLGFVGATWSAMPVPEGASGLFPHGREAPAGWTRITNDSGGLRVDGVVRCAEPVSASGGDERVQGDKLEIWLAPTGPVAFPDPGWGNQFGEHEIDPKVGCKEFATERGGVDSCRAWLKRLPGYRSHLRKLFVTRWSITADSVRETWQTPQYRMFAARYLPGEQESSARWDRWFLPRDVPRVDSFRASDSGFGFSVHVPWGAMPPTKDWRMSHTRVATDVFCRGSDSTARASSGTARKPIEGNVRRIPQVKLDPVPRWKFTACDLSPLGHGGYHDHQDLWFHPDTNSSLDTGFMIQNPAAGYLYVPSGIAPVLEDFGMFSTLVSQDRFVCGPRPVGLAIAGRRWFSDSLGLCASSGTQLRVVDVGSRKLLIDGPLYESSEWGSGQCGACDRLCFQVFELPGRGAPRRLFAAPYEIFGDDSDQYDIQWSPDHRRFTVLSNIRSDSIAPDSLVRLNDFCLGKSSFEPCGKQRTQRGLGTPQTPWIPYDQRGVQTGTP